MFPSISPFLFNLVLVFLYISLSKQTVTRLLRNVIYNITCIS
jgi:hypothetical protein